MGLQLVEKGVSIVYFMLGDCLLRRGGGPSPNTLGNCPNSGSKEGCILCFGVWVFSALSFSLAGWHMVCAAGENRLVVTKEGRLLPKWTEAESWELQGILRQCKERRKVVAAENTRFLTGSGKSN